MCCGHGVFLAARSPTRLPRSLLVSVCEAAELGFRTRITLPHYVEDGLFQLSRHGVTAADTIPWCLLMASHEGDDRCRMKVADDERTMGI